MLRATKNMVSPRFASRTRRRSPTPDPDSRRELSRSRRRRPQDSGWPDRGAQWPAVVVGESKLTDQATLFDGVCHHGWRNRIEQEFRTTEHRERSAVVDNTPREVDESSSRCAVDRGSPQIGWGLRRHDRAVEVPGHRLRVGADEAVEICLPFAALHCHVDVVVTVWEVWSWTALASRQVGAFDSDTHAIDLSRTARPAVSTS